MRLQLDLPDDELLPLALFHNLWSWCAHKKVDPRVFAPVELVLDSSTSAPRSPLNNTSLPKEALQTRLLELGGFASLHGNVNLMVPPLRITERELVMGLDTLDQTLEVSDAACRTAATGKGA